MNFNLSAFISAHVTFRAESLFSEDLRKHEQELKKEIGGRSVCVIGGAGSIGSAFLKALLLFGPSSLTVIDLSENGLAELVRDLRSSPGLRLPEAFRTYALDFADPIFGKILREAGGFDIVANFSAHKHVRSEKDRWAVQALLENNDLKARRLLDLLCEFPPRHFFCVSTDKAAGPVNLMGASKRLMEDLIMAYSSRFKVTTARFANVAFSAGSLPDSWLHRLAKRQPLTAPNDVRRYFVSPEESGQLCLLACIVGRSGEIFFPKLGRDRAIDFPSICGELLRAWGFRPQECRSEEEARRLAAALRDGGTACPAICSESDAVGETALRDGGTAYPVFYSGSDTTGEKACEEFFVPGEMTDPDRFAQIGVITAGPRRTLAEMERFFGELETLFARPDFTKEEVVAALEGFLPDFRHEEKGKNLDEKM